ncbi:IS630 family transposase [Aquisphaera insulae]|uniref:IS630 family transposase n=1 Tax=Aquisphaera insulae TaxID=2712864 RepID=UPI0013EB7F50|nr:IS630 family transposase [Aquisphaera insulae]
MEDTPTIPPECLEWRRYRALYLKHRGWFQRDVAEALDVSEESLSRWLSHARTGGRESLRARIAAGRPPRLTATERREIPELLWHGPEAYGFPGQVWTCARVARVIEEEFGVRYHKGHVSRLLKALHWTPQKPIKRATQRDEEAIRRWRDEVWPGLLRSARLERRTLVFEDESGFYLLPGMVKTYAPEGLTPILRVKQTRDHLSVMGGMTPEGRVFVMARQESLNGLHCIEFLEHLLRVAGDRLLVIWDGSPIHRRAEVKEFVANTRGRVWLESLPGYAPDLNPWDEGGWHHLKNVELRNVACRDLEELHQELYLAVGRVRQKPHLIRSCFAQAGLQIQ